MHLCSNAIDPEAPQKLDIAIANFVFAAGTAKPWSHITNIPNTGAVNPVSGARATLSLTHVPSTLKEQPH